MAFSSILVGQGIFCGILFSTFAVYANALIAEFNISQTQYMVVATAMGLASTLGSLLYYGILEKKVGLRKMFLIGGIVEAISCLVIATASNYAMLFAGVLLIGFGQCLVSNNTIAVGLNYWFKKGVGKLAGIIQAVESGVGTIMSNVVGLIIIGLGWRYGWWLALILCVLATIFCFIMYKGKPEELGEKPAFADELDEATGEVKSTAPVYQEGESFKDSFKTGKYWLAILVFFLGGVGCYMILSNLTLMCAYHGYTDQAGTIYSVALIAAFIWKLVDGALTDKLGAGWGMLLALLPVCIGGAMILLPSLSLGAIMVASFLIGCGLAWPASVLPVLIPSLSGMRDLGQKTPIASVSLGIGTTVSPIVFTALFESTGSYTLPVTIAIVLGILGCILCFVALKTKYRQ